MELRSITGAADELFLSQPVVTTHVRKLQERLGPKLLYREGHSMLPTEAGQLAYEWAKDVLTRSEEMSRRMDGLADGSAGQARLAASMTVGSYMLPTVLTRFRQEGPGARIGLDMFDPEHVAAAVESGEYDAGVTIAGEPSPRSTLVLEHVGDEEFVLVAAPESELPDELSSQQVRRLEPIGSPRDRVRAHLLNRMLAAERIAVPT